jgi:hypothetical protein
MAFQTSALPVRTVRGEGERFADMRHVGYHGSDHRDVAFSIKCDVRAVEGLGCKDAEHATVESAEGSRATDTAIVSGAIYCAKGMFFLLSWEAHGR